MGQGGTPGGLWLTNEPDSRLSHGLLWALQVQQGLAQVLICSAAMLCQLERAEGDGRKSWCRASPCTQDWPLLPGDPSCPGKSRLVPGFGGSRGLGAPRGAVVPLCRQSPAGTGLRQYTGHWWQGACPGWLWVLWGHPYQALGDRPCLLHLQQLPELPLIQELGSLKQGFPRGLQSSRDWEMAPLPRAQDLRPLHLGRVKGLSWPLLGRRSS